MAAVILILSDDFSWMVIRHMPQNFTGHEIHGILVSEIAS